MVFSKLATKIKLSPNYNPRGSYKIKRFTPHCIVGQYAALDVANWSKFNEKHIASANYIIGKDGEILGNVSEDNRAWTSGGNKSVNGHTGKMNDYESITVECASDASAPWSFKPIVYEALINLCVDICKRYNKVKTVWISDAAKAEEYAKTMPDNELLLTVHRWYAAASCPGDWMYNKMDEFSQSVNKILSDINPDELYHVQIGAFANKDNADKLAAELKAKGYDTYIVRY